MKIIAFMLIIAWTVIIFIAYHKLVDVYYFNLVRGIGKELIFSFFFGVILTSLTIYFWWIVVAAIAILGFINYKKTDDKLHITATGFLCVITAIIGIILKAKFK